MRIIERYLLKTIVTIFISAIIIFCFLYVLIDLASNLDEFIRQKVSIEILIQYYLSFLPIIIAQTSPLACLIACLLTFSHANSNNEIIVLRSGGLSFWRIAKPAIYFGLIVSVLMFWVNERFVPQATSMSQSIEDEYLALSSDAARKKQAIDDLTFYGLKNRLFYIDKFNPADFSLHGVTIIGHDENQQIKEKIVALNGKWTGIAWRFYRLQITSFDIPGDATTESIRYYDDKLMDIKETPQDFLRQRLDVNSMNIKQLHQYIKRFTRSGAQRALNNLSVDFHQKIAFPFSNLVILLVGLPLALMTNRRKALTFTSLGIAVGVGFIFYVLNAVGLAFGKGGLLPPILSAWMAPGICLLVSLYLLRTKF
ncbi:MAG: LPS export ABC transporter permease LptG [Candidatus Omnitrophica bacterium]|nr:LPS export ABC transporter permease LptG [Candidatus Omnitrophota bacterium]